VETKMPREKSWRSHMWLWFKHQWSKTLPKCKAFTWPDFVGQMPQILQLDSNE